MYTYVLVTFKNVNFDLNLEIKFIFFHSLLLQCVTQKHREMDFYKKRKEIYIVLM